MTIKLIALSAATALALSGCAWLEESASGDKTNDYGWGSGDLANLQAGIWVDPHGCDHWIIDDGIEGYLSARLGPDGKPVCSGTAVPNTITGPFEGGAEIGDFI